MPFRIFRAGNLSRQHERRQMDHLVSLLRKEFGSRVEDVRLVIDFQVGLQVDSVVFKDGKFIILELKNIGGRITASLDLYGTWSFNMDEEDIALDRSPFSQVYGQRGALTRFLWEDVLQNQESLHSHTKQTASFWRHFSGWVVTKPGADIKFVDRDPSEVPWFTALPTDDVSRSLRFERGEGRLFSEESFNRFIELIGAEETSWDEWMLRGTPVSIDEYIAPVKVPRIDFLLSSNSPENIRRGLQYVSELGLEDYLPEVSVASANPNESIREMALEMLLSWDPPGLGRILVQFLSDDSPRLRNHALNVMSERPCPEAIPELIELLDSGNFNVVVAALRALGATEHNEAREAVLGYAKSQPFDGRPGEAFPWSTLINTLGRLRCKEAIPWLLDFLSHLEGLGPLGEDDRIDIVREDVIYSLGEIGDSRALEPLAERFRTYTDEWIVAPMRAVGRLGNHAAVDHLVPYLDANEDFLRREAVGALCSIGSPEVFGPLSRFYFEYLDERGLSNVHHHIEDTLVSIDPEKTERLVLDYIQEKELADDEIGWRMMYILCRVASDACIDTVFPYLKNRTFYLQAAEVLWEVEPNGLQVRVEELLESEDPYERAAAVWYMHRKWGGALLTRLKEFEADPHAVVRRAVADVYSFMRNDTGRTCLMRMADDDDLIVQWTVYHALIGEQKCILDDCWVGFDAESHKVRYLMATEWGVISWLGKEDYPREDESAGPHRRLFRIKPETLRRAAVVRLPDDVDGLYLAGLEGEEKKEWLIISESRCSFRPVDEEMRKFRHELEGVSGRDMGPSSLSEEESESMDNLWNLRQTQ